MANTGTRDVYEDVVGDAANITLRGMVVQIEPCETAKDGGDTNTVFVMRIELHATENDKLTQLLHKGDYRNVSSNIQNFPSLCEIDNRKNVNSDSTKDSGSMPTMADVVGETSPEFWQKCSRCKTMAASLKWVTETAFNRAFDRPGRHPTIEDVASKSNNLRVPEHLTEILKGEPNLVQCLREIGRRWKTRAARDGLCSPNKTMPQNAMRTAIVCLHEVLEWYKPLIHNLPVHGVLGIVKHYFHSEQRLLKQLKDILSRSATNKKNGFDDRRKEEQEMEILPETESEFFLTLNDDEYAETHVNRSVAERNCAETLTSGRRPERQNGCLLWVGTVDVEILSNRDRMATVETCATTYKRACDVIQILDLVEAWKGRI